VSQLSTYFLPYQVNYLQDQSRFKEVKKSRRTGFTYVQSYEDTRDAARQNNPLDVWFSSADESAAKEYILYVAQWARILNIAAQDLGETVISKNDDIKALTVQFATGRRINALSSNPKAFRSKGGKLVLDEFAHPS
jgi:phage FluMu gp28-like protein